MSKNIEVIQKDDYGEFISCICGNTAMDSGFYPCDAFGNEQVPDERWNGDLYVCFDCGRIVNQWTGRVVGMAIEGAIRL